MGDTIALVFGTTISGNSFRFRLCDHAVPSDPHEMVRCAGEEEDHWASWGERAVRNVHFGSDLERQLWGKLRALSGDEWIKSHMKGTVIRKDCNEIFCVNKGMETDIYRGAEMVRSLNTIVHDKPI